MADETANSAAKERQERINQQTSFGHYAVDSIKGIAISIAGAVTGFLAGSALNKSFIGSNKAKDFQDVFADKNPGAVRGILPIAGAMVGLIVSGIINGYGRWKKQEQEALAVVEINQDVATVVEERGKFANTLNRQEDYIKSLIADRSMRDPLDRTSEVNTTMRQ